MSIEKVNENLPLSTRISELNDMVLELEGLISKANFNLNEINALYTALGSGYTRQFLRNQLLGNAVDTYTDWEHVYAESGYSIWKCPLTDYSYNSLNELYMDNKILSFKGQADSESALFFDKVGIQDGSVFTEYTDDAKTASSDEFTVMTATDDYLYLGSSAFFNGVKFVFQTRGSNYTLKLEYYNGAEWVEITSNANNLEDNTSNFESDGTINWSELPDWDITEIDGTTIYFIRISTTSIPVTEAKAYQIVPSTSVIGLLALSSSQIFDEEWAWCSYNNHAYVTIRNTGNTSYEGDYYITSASSVTNLQNFFIYNHIFSANYEDSNF